MKHPAAQAPTWRERGFWLWIQDLDVGPPVGQRSYTDPHTGRTWPYDYAVWTSPEVPVGFAATEVIASWTSTTPPATWLQVELRGVTESGESTKWFEMGRWSADDATLLRTSVPGQADAHGDVRVDTFAAADGHAWTALQVRVTAYRPVGDLAMPVLRSVAAVATRAPGGPPLTSDPLQARGVVLDVPGFSQTVHRGEYPQWNGGGQAWCSPTSTSMVLAFWRASPTPEQYAWVDPAFLDPWVHHAVRGVFDYSYQGAGNWAFNVAYAGEFGMSGFITRLQSLNEAEAYIAAGIPLILSLSFRDGQIGGLTYGTNGHLLVLVGFSPDGDPVLNDPASPSNDRVRKAVDRSDFELAWLSSSKGVAYVMHPATVLLPPPSGTS